MKVPGTTMAVDAAKQNMGLEKPYRYFLALICGVLVFSICGNAQKPKEEVKPIHEAWDELLHKHVTDRGMVSYRGFKEDQQVLEEYLSLLAENPPGKDVGKKEKLAYYINLYNAGTVKLILTHYPISSIKKISDPWGIRFLKVGSVSYSLEEIEHDILRKMEEPRIHFAINCASISCPKLKNEAYIPSHIHSQLEQATKDFLRDTTRNHLVGNEWRISKIFRWFKSDFNLDGGVIFFINHYLENPRKDPSISYLDYDWRLNGN